MHRKITRAAVTVAFALASASALAAKSPNVERQLEALRKAQVELQAQLEAQQQQLEAQAAELAALRSQDQQKNTAEVAKLQTDIGKLNQSATQSKLASQDAPRLSFTGNRPTV